MTALDYSTYDGSSSSSSHNNESNNASAAKYTNRRSAPISSSSSSANSLAKTSKRLSSSSSSSSSSSPYSSSPYSSSLQFSPYLLQMGGGERREESGDDGFRRLIEKVTKVNLESSGNDLANFEPLKHFESASLVNKENFEPVAEGEDNNNNNNNNKIFGPALLPVTPFAKDREKENRSRQVIPNTDLYSGAQTNYSTSYLNQWREHTGPASSDHLLAAAHNNHGTTTKTMVEKLNYLIFLLEDQQNQRTNNITEDFIMYMFLGIFVIFMIDSLLKNNHTVRRF